MLALWLLSGCVASPETQAALAVRPGAHSVGNCVVTAGFVEEGRASWYGRRHQGRRTANGDAFSTGAMTAAHRKLPLGTRVKVTNLRNGRAADFVINDRGPYRRGRILDVSHQGARELGFEKEGTAPVRVEAVERC